MSLTTDVRWMLVFILSVISFTSSLPLQDLYPRRRPVYSNPSESGQLFLRKFGYLQSSQTSHLDTSVFTESVRSFQHLWGLPETGQVDTETREWMEKPRCGSSDNNLLQHRSKRFTVLEKGGWKKTHITYRLQNSAHSLSLRETQYTIYTAFTQWSKVSGLTFRQVTDSSEPSDIEISFSNRTHGDGYPFDGTGGVLAHAFAPQSLFYAGDVHFDDDEPWVINEYSRGSKDLYQVAIHEIGHALGLGHSIVFGSVMYPYYKNGFKAKLDEDDIEGIQSLYGKREGEDTVQMTSTQKSTVKSNTERITKDSDSEPSTDAAITTTSTVISTEESKVYTSTTSTPDVSTVNTASTTAEVSVITDITTTRVTESSTDLSTTNIMSTIESTTTPIDPSAALCANASVNAITTDKLGKLFVFSGDYVTQIDLYKPGHVSGYPKLISQAFPELPSNIDASIYLPDLWQYRCEYIGHSTHCSPHKLLETERLILFKGDQYYMYREGTLDTAMFAKSKALDNLYPGIPTPLDAVFTIDGRKVYFVKGDQYWRVSRKSGTDSIDPGFPKSLSEAIQGLETPVSAVARMNIDIQQYIYFFSDSKYNRMSKGKGVLDKDDYNPYPRSVATWWFGCEMDYSTEGAESTEMIDRGSAPIDLGEDGLGGSTEWEENEESELDLGGYMNTENSAEKVNTGVYTQNRVCVDMHGNLIDIKQ